jgi:hypothetical protein
MNTNSQSIINYKQLSFKNHKAYCQGKLFTGSARAESRDYISIRQYIDGLRYGSEKTDQQIITYKNNFVKNFKYLDKSERIVLNINIDSIHKNATDARLKVVFRGEKNDTVYAKAHEEKDYIDFNIACVIQYDYIHYDTLNINSFKFKECTISAICGGFTQDLFPPIKRPAIDLKVLFRLGNPGCSLFLSDIKITDAINSEFESLSKRFYFRNLFNN